MKTHYTATEIAGVICQSERLTLQDHTDIHNRVRYIAKQGHLSDGERIDARGTLAFAPLEVYRAAIYCEFMALGLDIRSLRHVVSAATRRHDHSNTKPPSQKVEGGWLSFGGLRDSIIGVRAGEKWLLILQLQMPGHADGGGLVADFVWEEAQDLALEERVRAITGRAATRVWATLDLTRLYNGILPQVELPA